MASLFDGMMLLGAEWKLWNVEIKSKSLLIGLQWRGQSRGEWADTKGFSL